MKKLFTLSTFLFAAYSLCFGQFTKLAEITPGNLSSLANQKGAMAQLGNTVFFSAETDSGVELWKTDGTSAGTKLVKDINPGTAGSKPDHFYVVGNLLLFTADNGVTGRELWKTDGTDAGTALLADIRPGTSSAFEDWFFELGSTDFQVFKGELYFRAFDSQEGLELWKSDGSTAGTVRVKSIAPGFSDGCQGDFEEMNGELYFVGFSSQYGAEIWKTDGTDAGTVAVTTNLSQTPEDLKALGNVLLFVKDEIGSGPELWKTDGTQAGTALLKNTDPVGGAGGLSHQLEAPEERFFVAGTKAYFSVVNSDGDAQLWVTDGTENGTQKLKSVGSSHYPPSHFVQLGNQVMFLAHKFADEIWISDGTTNGTKLVLTYVVGVSYAMNPPFLLTHAHDGYVWFSASFQGVNALYKTDGVNTEMAMNPFVNSIYNPKRFFSFGNKMIFWASTISSGLNYEPFVYAPPLQVTGAVTNATCHGDNNGAISVEPSGTAPFQANWSPSGVSGLNPTSLPAGTYTVTVTDAGGSTGSATFEISEPEAITANFVVTDQTGSGLGAAFVNVTGGTAPYSISWNTNPPQTGPIAVNLTAGDYICVITDSKGCSATATAQVVMLVGTNDPADENAVVVAPNPASEWLQLIRANQSDPILQCRIFDASGKLMRSIDHSGEGRIFLGGLPGGLMTMQVLVENRGWQTLRFQKVN